MSFRAYTLALLSLVALTLGAVFLPVGFYALMRRTRS